MDAMTVLSIMQLAAVLTPQAVVLTNTLIDAFNRSDMSDDEKLRKINELLENLKPMELKK